MRLHPYDSIRWTMTNSRGVPIDYDNPRPIENMEFPVSSELPEKWPDDWDPNRYQFPDLAYQFFAQPPEPWSA